MSGIFKGMRVLFVSSGLSDEAGGAALSEAGLCQELARSVQLVLWCRRQLTDARFVERHQLSCSTYSPIPFIGRLLAQDEQLFRQFSEIDVCHLNGHWKIEYFFLAWRLRQLRIPFVIHPRGMFWVGGRKQRLKYLYNLLVGAPLARWASRIIALSHFETKQFSALAVEQAQIAIIANGISVPATTGGAPLNTPYFLYLGRIEPRKNLDFLLEGYARYREGGGKSPLVLVGPAELVYRKKLRNQIARYKLDQSVVWKDAEYGAEKSRWMAHAIATIYPTTEEAFGRVPFECALAGGFPLFPQESGATEYLGDKLPGAIFSLSNPQDLSDAIVRVEKLSLELRTQQIQNAKTYIQKTLTWSKSAASVRALYEALKASDRFRHQSESGHLSSSQTPPKRART